MIVITAYLTPKLSGPSNSPGTVGITGSILKNNVCEKIICFSWRRIHSNPEEKKKKKDLLSLGRTVILHWLCVSGTSELRNPPRHTKCTLVGGGALQPCCLSCAFSSGLFWRRSKRVLNSELTSQRFPLLWSRTFHQELGACE